MDKKTKIIYYALILALFVAALAFFLIAVFGGDTYRWGYPVGMISALVGNIINLIRVIKLKKQERDKHI